MSVRFFEHANFDFVGPRTRRLIRFVSVAVVLFAILPGLLWMLGRGSFFNMGVDFTGGTLLQVEFAQPVDVGDIRALLEPRVAGTQISRLGGEDEFLIRAPRFAEGGANVSDAVAAALRERFGDNGVRVVRTEAVGPKVGSELRTRAVIAVALSFLTTLLYLAFRLEWRAGLATVIATIHDILFIVGIIAALRLEVSLTTVAALLTIIGYSMNDTIVVFDRVRENLKTAKRQPLGEVVNRSVNETLPRTVMTGGSVLAVLLVLFLLGGLAIRDFALIMFLGTVVGTYSSIFIASNVYIEIHRRWGTRRPAAHARDRAAPQTAGV